jgi:IS605 OrfB family transposase
LFHRWFGITRFAYNEALRLINEKGWKPCWKTLKSHLLNKYKNDDACAYPWLFDNNLCPCDAKVSAIHDLCSAIATTKESLKAKNLNQNNFWMKKRERKDMCQRVHMHVNGGRPSVTWNKDGFKFWPRTGVGIVRPYKQRELNRLEQNECKFRVTIKYESPNRYFLLIPIVINKKKRKEKEESVIAFDPGVRTFQTGFTNKGHFVEYGKKGIGKLISLGKRMDKLKSKIDSHNKNSYSSRQERIQYKNQRRRWRKRMSMLRYRVQNLKRDMHWKVARDIVQKNTHVLISKFQVSRMAKKIDRKVGSETVKKMLNWSHFEFRQRLRHKANEFGAVIHEVSEHYSSKSCGNCGRINWKLGGSKIFTCPYCKFTINRDFNGSRNILLMNIENHLKVVNPMPSQ